jgi:hypothetical protein
LQELKMKGKWKVLTDPAAGHCRGIWAKKRGKKTLERSPGSVPA